MPEHSWHKVLQSLTPMVFRIATPDGYGTGFQILYTPNKGLCGIATAYHVIDHADEWDEAIKITHYATGKTTVLKAGDGRVIFKYPDNDLAFILFDSAILPIETTEPVLMEPDMGLKRGVEVGWCGFPSVARIGELCFFAGHISSWRTKDDAYLVDGVAINGVSGGPAFTSDSKGVPKICGVISAYKANRVYGETLPGICIVQSVEPYHKDLKNLHSLEEAAAKAKQEKEEAEKKLQSQTTPEAPENSLKPNQPVKKRAKRKNKSPTK